MDNGASSYRRFLEGDDSGIVEIIRDYKDGLILFLNRYVNNIHTAEELAEDTFFRIVTRKPRFVAKYSFKTWLYTIGRNIAINHVKHFGKVASIPLRIWKAYEVMKVLWSSPTLGKSRKLCCIRCFQKSSMITAKSYI